jgi:hypothetical protein
MGRAVLADFIDIAPRMEMALHWHLEANMYPPMPYMYNTCLMAIACCIEGNSEAIIDLPEGLVTNRGDSQVSAGYVVNSMHLHDFIASAQYDAYGYDGDAQ